MSYVWVCMCVCLFRLITRRMNRLFNIDRFQLDTKRTSYSQSKSNIKHQISYTHNTFSCRFLFFRPFTSSSLLHGFHSSNNYHSFFFSSTIQLISKLLLLSTKKESHKIFIKSIFFSAFLFNSVLNRNSIELFFSHNWDLNNPEKIINPQKEKGWCSYWGRSLKKKKKWIRIIFWIKHHHPLDSLISPKQTFSHLFFFNHAIVSQHIIEFIPCSTMEHYAYHNFYYKHIIILCENRLSPSFKICWNILSSTVCSPYRSASFNFSSLSSFYL